MEDNPYSKFWEAAPPDRAGLRLRRGIVRTAAPLVVEVAGITISGTELLVNANLVPHKVRIIPENPLQSPFYATIDPLFNSGDQLLMLTEDDQVFHVLCKVVGA